MPENDHTSAVADVMWLAFENSIYQVSRLPFLQCECDKIADEPDKVKRVLVDNNDMSVL